MICNRLTHLAPGCCLKKIANRFGSSSWKLRYLPPLSRQCLFHPAPLCWEHNTMLLEMSFKNPTRFSEADHIAEVPQDSKKLRRISTLPCPGLLRAILFHPVKDPCLFLVVISTKQECLVALCRALLHPQLKKFGWKKIWVKKKWKILFWKQKLLKIARAAQKSSLGGGGPAMDNQMDRPHRRVTSRVAPQQQGATKNRRIWDIYSLLCVSNFINCKLLLNCDWSPVVPRFHFAQWWWENEGLLWDIYI